MLNEFFRKIAKKMYEKVCITPKSHFNSVTKCENTPLPCPIAEKRGGVSVFVHSGASALGQLQKQAIFGDVHARGGRFGAAVHPPGKGR